MHATLNNQIRCRPFFKDRLFFGTKMEKSENDSMWRLFFLFFVKFQRKNGVEFFLAFTMFCESQSKRSNLLVFKLQTCFFLAKSCVFSKFAVAALLVIQRINLGTSYFAIHKLYVIRNRILFHFIFIFILLTRRKATEALIHKAKKLPRPASGDVKILLSS